MTKDVLDEANQLIAEIEDCNNVIESYKGQGYEVEVSLGKTEPVILPPTFGNRVIEIINEYKRTLEQKFGQL